MILYHSGKLGNRSPEDIVNVLMYHSGSKGRLADDTLEFLQAQLGTEGLPSDLAAIMLQGRSRLISYVEIRDEVLLLDEVLVLAQMHPNLCLDSGAFSVMGGNAAEIDINVYGKFLVRHGDLFTWYANLDVIPVVETDMLSAAEASMVNLEYLEREHDLKPMGIFHFGEPIEFLDRIVDGGRRSYIGVGGLVGIPRPSRMDWLETVFAHVGKDVKIHGYGIGDEVIIKAFPWYSVDCTNWLTACRFGEWPPYHSGIYTLTARVLPWVEYLDAMASAQHADYEGKEDEDQATLFKTVSMDRDRVRGPQTIGPAAAVWPGDDHEKGARAREFIKQGPRELGTVVSSLLKKPRQAKSKKAAQRKAPPSAVPTKVLTADEQQARRDRMDRLRGETLAKETPAEAATKKYDGIRCTCSPMGTSTTCPRHGKGGTEVTLS